MLFQQIDKPDRHCSFGPQLRYPGAPGALRLKSAGMLLLTGNNSNWDGQTYVYSNQWVANGQPADPDTSVIAYGSMCMEPVFMILGQAGGTAAALSIDQGTPVQGINDTSLRQQLIADDALLDWHINIVPMVGTAAADFNDLTGLPVLLRYTTTGTAFPVSGARARTRWTSGPAI